MDTAHDEPSVSANKATVVFRISSHRRTVECAITRQALVQYFWAPADADDARLLKAFADGSKRIAAVAERKMLTAQHEPVVLNAADFADRGFA
ncbi:DUF1488 family protein [Paraburkholderia sp. BL10I2N1]|nr:DUF1488 family protein [Paraburkholderia sp. BL10I2N1]TDN70979.1 uncharacterized protein DUF1488 [Paraburkholderia sp. BL10I2N1]